MTWVTEVVAYLRGIGIYTTTMKWQDVVEILIIAFLVFYILRWMKNTRAWSLLKGIIVIALFLLLAYLLKMETILWIASNILTFAVTALLIVLQPELRKGLENLGRKSFIGSIIPAVGRHDVEGINNDVITEIVKACIVMGKARTGALIVIQRSESLNEYVTTGISVDGLVTSALLINIFEKNTPLHDGAAIINGNRVVAATCYLPLSDSLDLSKDLGTRHRAGTGVSEKTDSVTIIVSEETGRISIAVDGKLESISDGENLRSSLQSLLLTGDKKRRKRRRSGNTVKEGAANEKN